MNRTAAIPTFGVFVPTILIVSAFGVVFANDPGTKPPEALQFDYQRTAKLAEATHTDVWKWLAIFMAGNVASGLLGFITLHRRIVTVAEVREIVLKESPWNVERSGIYQRLDMLRDDDLEMKERVKRMEGFLFENRNEMMELFAGVSARIDAVKTDIHNGFMAVQKQIGGLRSGAKDDDD